MSFYLFIFFVVVVVSFQMLYYLAWSKWKAPQDAGTLSSPVHIREEDLPKCSLEQQSSYEKPENREPGDTYLDIFEEEELFGHDDSEHANGTSRNNTNYVSAAGSMPTILLSDHFYSVSIICPQSLKN